MRAARVQGAEVVENPPDGREEAGTVGTAKMAMTTSKQNGCVAKTMVLQTMGSGTVGATATGPISFVKSCRPQAFAGDRGGPAVRQLLSISGFFAVREAFSEHGAQSFLAKLRAGQAVCDGSRHLDTPRGGSAQVAKALFQQPTVSSCAARGVNGLPRVIQSPAAALGVM